MCNRSSFSCCSYGANALKIQSQLAANPISYGANMKHVCTYGAIRADVSLNYMVQLEYCLQFSAKAVPKAPTKWTTALPVLQKLCKSLKHGDMLSVHTDTHSITITNAQTQGFSSAAGRYVHSHTVKSRVTTRDVPQCSNTRTHSMSNTPLPLYNLGTIFLWCYYVNRKDFV